MRKGRQAGKRQSGGADFKVLSGDDINDIHLATLEVLEKTGVRVGDQEALELLHGGGARVEANTGVVKIPAYMVEDAIHSCPPKLMLYGRHPKNDLSIESNRIAFANFGGALNLLDPYTGDARACTQADLNTTARLVDYLDDIDLYKVPGRASDVPQKMLQVHNTRSALTHTTKPFYMSGGNVFQMRHMRAMAAAVVGGEQRLRERPIMILSVCPVSPLKMPPNTCECIMECARSGIPVSITSMALAGVSAPITLAGALIVHNAEILSAAVLHQLAQKGASLTYGSVTTTMDMQYSMAPIGSPEIAMVSAAVAQMAHHYRLPSNVGGGSDSKLPDGQAAHEITLTALLPALAGANIITGAGILEAGKTLSLSQLVMDCEFIRMIQRVVGGIPVNDDTMALDIIHEIGSSNDFLSHDHTFDHLHTSQAHPRLIDRRTRDDWEQQGSKDMHRRALEKAWQIMDTHQPEPLPAEVSQTLDAIVAEAEAQAGE